MKKIQFLVMLLWLSVCFAEGAVHESPVPESNIRLVHGPYLQNLGPNEVTIVWLSDKPSVGWVELAPDDDTNFYAVERPKYYDARNGVKNTSTIHTVKIKGLKPGTNYRYRVFAQEVLSHVGHRIVYGYCASTDVYSRKPLVFKTSDPANKTVSFAMVNDIHGKNDVLTNLVSKCDLKKTDFFLFNGDMVSVFNEENHIFDGFMDTATRLFASEIPMYYTRGNHETRGAFATEFQRYFSPKETNIYYTFRQGPICFVILDTGEDKPDSDIEYAGITVYDEYRTEQAEWLRQVLDSKEYKEAPFKIIVAHIPPIGGWHGNLEVERKFMPLLREAKPDVMLCGHLHQFIHQDATAQTPFPIIVNSNTAVLKATADPNELKIQVVDVDGKMLDQFSIKK
ncbi:metallophosphoesterase [Parabacteroides massiliensis]|uniref:metallophosphoesterase n=1 Tax=Parabacteroides massiliensis TaxID=1750560 RepID=UPI00096A4FB9|nr:metallophosphoesterase [Parabacteroides massiliensis]